MTTVVLVEDDPYFCDLVLHALSREEHIEVIGVHHRAEDALREIPRSNPDVVLMDIVLPGMDGIDGVRKLKALNPAQLVVMLTAYDDDELIFQALRAGANGYLIKPTTPVELLAALKDVHTGGAPMSSSIARKVVQSFHQGQSASSPREENLSRRESEILDLLATGYAYKEIADRLGISYETVCTHVRSVYRKLQVQSRAQATFKYLNP